MVRTRFAPSPTGYLHIGGLRTALFNWLFTRRQGGQFILRIDDTDTQRNIQEALTPILKGLSWLGIDWDEGPEVGGPHEPYYQSQRRSRHQAAVEELIRRGAAYRDYATTEEIQEERAKAMAANRTFVYSRRWMAETPGQQARFEAEGRQAVVRLKMPREGKLVINDLIRGRVEFEWLQEQDHVIQRADGSVLYHLASAVDDHDLEITHVIRAEEHLSNTPRQVFVLQSLGYELPEYAHLPLVAEPGSRSKLSKRKLALYCKNKDFAALMALGARVRAALGEKGEEATFELNPVVVDFYRKVGFLPQALVNYLALLGWSLDEKSEDFTPEELQRVFSLDRVNKAPAGFDPVKLMAFEERHMRRLSVAEKVELVQPYLKQAGLITEGLSNEERAKIEAILVAAGDRIKVLGDILEYRYFFVADEELKLDEEGLKKCFKQAGAVQLLRKFGQELETLSPFEPPVLEGALKKFAEARGVKLGEIIHPLRLAVTGRTTGFGLFETLAILGRRSCLARINQAIARESGNC